MKSIMHQFQGNMDAGKQDILRDSTYKVTNYLPLVIFCSTNKSKPIGIMGKLYTVKFLNFRTPENFAVIYLKFKQRHQTLGISSKNAN